MNIVFRVGRHFVVSWFILALFLDASCKKSGNAPAPGTNTGVSTFTNPLLQSAPDPWVFQKDSLYYYTHTLGNRIQIWKTGRMSKLANVTPVTVFTAPDTGGNSRDIWAPELFFLDNKWYLYYTGSDGEDRSHRLWVLENESPDPTTGTWVSRGRLTTDPADLWSIDATVLEHRDGRYLIWSGRPFNGGSNDLTQNLYISKMSDAYTLTGPTVQIATPEFEWEKRGFGVNEGPEILTNPAGQVFLMYSGSYCGDDRYGLGVIRLAENADPMQRASWTKLPQPFFTGLASSQAYGVGHNGFFKSKDHKEDWILYHANSSAGQGCGSARNVRMQKFTWTADGLPNFGEPVPIGQALAVPSGE